MSKAKRLVFIFFFILLCILISKSFLDKKELKSFITDNINPTYQSEYNNILMYNQEGVLNYHLVTRHAECFFEQGISKFICPKLTIYDKDRKIAAWIVTSDRAELGNEYIFHLHGHVKIDSLLDFFQVQKITTDNAEINLITQDVTSEGFVTFYGKKFSSIGLQMQGNLRRKDAKIMKKVRAFYEIQK